MIRDQVVEKCASSYLRRKLLEKGRTLNLTQVRDIARAVEDSDRQARSIEGLSANVNKITLHDKSVRPKEKPPKRPTNKPVVTCYNCGYEGHKSKDPNCPAKDKKCRKCGKIGHFEARCKTGTSKSHRSGSRRQSGGKQVRQISEPPIADSDYAFTISNVTSGGCEMTIDVNVGGVQIPMIVDSGASCNVIGRDEWENLKSNGVKCQSSRDNITKLYAYGSSNPLPVAGNFIADISVSGTTLHDVRFNVVETKGQSLLGRETALKLNVLKVGPQINNIETNEYSVPIGSKMTKSDLYGVPLGSKTVMNEFPEVTTGFGKLKDYKLKIPIDSEVQPVIQPIRRVPYHLREKLGNKLDELESLDIIEKVNGPTEWLSPVVCVPKGNDDIRLCVDMRVANIAVKRERYPIPTVDEVLQELNNSSVFSKIDLRMGFFQIELDEASRDITTFGTHKGPYRYKRLIMGISCAPEMYQKVMQQVLQDCEGAHNIQDDIIVHGSNQEEHDKRLRKVLSVLRDKGLTVNVDKCELNMSHLVFMGHVLSSKGIGPAEVKVKAIVETREPETVSEVKSFLGLVTFSSRYIPDFSTVSEPLRRLTKCNQPFVWGPEQKQAFEKLKNLVSQADTLGYYDINASTQVIADASPVGLGAVLVQKQNDEYRVISYASRSLSDVERRYSQTEREALSLVWACERFHSYLFGSKFELLTDHKPLEFIFSPRSKPSARIERWVLRLQPYQYTVRYIKGSTNIADALSRLLPKSGKKCEKPDIGQEYIRFVAQEATPCAMTTREIERASESDVELQSVRDCLLSGAWHDLENKHYVAIQSELSAIGKLVLRGTRIIIPSQLRERTLQLAHEGHPGIVNMKKVLRTKVWWPGIDKDVEKFCKSCYGCQLVSQTTKPEPMVRTEMPNGPWQYLAADMLGPMPTGESILVVIDYYSRYYEIEILRSTTSDKIIEAMSKFFATHGLPLTIRTDNAANFTSEKFTSFLRSNGITHHRNTPLWPQANGEVERQNRSLMKRIRISHATGRDWKADLQSYLLIHRSTPYTTTGVSPAELLFKRKIRTKLPDLQRYNVEDIEIRDRDSENKGKGKLYADQKRGAVESNLEQGDRVLVKQDRENKFSTPLHPEPFTLVDKRGNMVVVESQSGSNYKRNVTHVKKFLEPQNVKLEYNNPTGVIDLSLSDDDDAVADSSGPNMQEHVNPPATPSKSPPKACDTSSPLSASSRPVRVKQMPARYKDYVTT